MPHFSHYYNLDRPPKGWTKEEFASAVFRLEELTHDELVELARAGGIAFSDHSWGEVSQEDLINALIADLSAREVVALLARVRQSGQSER